MQLMMTTESRLATKRPRMFINIAAGGFVLTGIVNTFMGPLLPTLIGRWRLSDSEAGYFFALQFLGSILGTLGSATLMRRGFRFAIAFSYLLMAAGVCGVAMHQWESALAGSFVLGIGFGGAIPSTNLMISSAYHERPAGPLSLLNFCWGLGAISVPITIFFISGPRYLFLFLPILGFVLVLTTFSLAIVSAGGLGLPNKEKDSHNVSRPLPLVALGAMFFLYVAIESSIGGWITTLAKRDYALAGLTLAPCLFWGGLLLGRGIAPLMFMRMSERHWVLAGLSISAIGIFSLVVVSKWQYIAAAGFIVGLGLSPVFPITVALLSQSQKEAARNASVMFALAGLGGAVMPEVVGIISTATGSLQNGLAVPLIATGALLWLHSRTYSPVNDA
jgi:FHS family glucose/mannose:H+ symporter-like MFS transporter